MNTPAEDIRSVIGRYKDDSRALEDQLIQITFYMRGGVNIDQAYMMTYHQRRMALKLIEENVERTNKSGVMMH